LTTLNFGFLTVLNEANGYLGGYLVTNAWGRPLEFRLTTLVQPNKVQQILYGPSLRPYLYGDLIGKTLYDKTAAAANLIVTDQEAALEVRLHVPTPTVAILGPDGASESRGERILRLPRHGLIVHERHPEDVDAVRAMLPELERLDLAEPFGRIREALQEARKAGATQRAA
jgi:hypothetical protein